MSGIALENISKTFEGRPVLTEFSHVFPAGRLTCIQGPSGCGKTTLLRLLAGLETPDRGRIAGRPDRLAFVFQEDRLCEDFNAVRNALLGCESRGAEEKARAHLRALGLGDSLAQPVRTFSGGMKRRVAMARALCREAQLLLLDEPFTGLDDTLRRQVMDYVKKNTAGKTVICVTHEPSEAAYLGGELLRMERP